MPKYSDVRAVLEKAVNNLDGAERQLATEAMQDLYCMMDLGLKLADTQDFERIKAVVVDMLAISGKYHD